MKSEAEKEYERQIDRERKRMHMERVERHLDESRRQAEYNSPKQQQMREEQNQLIIKGGLILLALAALFLMILALLSPGILIFIYSAKQIAYQASTIEHWLYSTAISLSLFCVAYLLTRSVKIGSAIYLAACLAASSYAYTSTFDGVNTIEYAVNSFWPFGEAKKTAQNSDANASIDTKKIADDFARKQTQMGTPKAEENSYSTPEAGPHTEVTTEDEINQKNQEANEPAENSSIKASFDCTKASRPTEIMICSDPELADLDLRLDAAYKSVILKTNDPASIKSEQISWIKNIARPCEDKACLELAYKQRISELESL